MEKQLQPSSKNVWLKTGQYKCCLESYVPWRLIYKEEFDCRIEARKREKYLKSGIGREFIKQNTMRPRGATE